MLQGELYTFPLMDLIQWLAFTRRTGQLSLAQAPAPAQVGGVSAGVALAATPSPAPRLYVEIYFLEGRLTGAFLGGRGAAVDGQQLRAVLALVMNWRLGRFTFCPDEMPAWARSVPHPFAAEPLLRAAQTAAEAKRPLDAACLFEREQQGSGHSDTFTLAEHLRLYAVSRILKGDFTIPALPDLAVRVLELTSDENFSLRALGDLVIKDQAVAAQVLRYANSPLFGYTHRVDSLEQAVKRIGAGQVVNIVLAAAIQTQRQPQERFADEKNLLWKHSSAAAFIARTIAEKVELKGSLAFTCGLLMDFGTTVLYSIFQDLLQRRAIARTIPPQLIESVVWEHHMRIGRVVGERWRLPHVVIEAMAYHHALEQNYGGIPYVGVAALADYLATLAIHTPRIDLKPALERFSASLLVNHPAGKLIRLNAQQAVEVLLEIPQNLRQSQEFAFN
jgi:HD-like signal output (HDOD) protein